MGFGKQLKDKMDWTIITNLTGIWAWIISILLLAIIIFVIIQFITMILSKKLRRVDKGIWAILFFTFTILTAIVWWFVKRK